MSLSRTRWRILSVLGLPVVGMGVEACQPMPGAGPGSTVASDVVVVAIEGADGVAFNEVEPDEDKKPLFADKGPLRRCGKDRYRAWKCGNVGGDVHGKKASEPYRECTVTSQSLRSHVYYPRDVVWGANMPFDPKLTRHYRKHGVGHRQRDDACCYSQCKSVVVTRTADKVPTGWYESTQCVPSFSRTSIPAAERSDCAANIQFRGGPDGKFSAPFTAKGTKAMAHQPQSYGGLKGVGVCCYDVARYPRVMRGRPIRVDGEVRTAQPIDGAAWLAAVERVTVPTSGIDREAVAQRWSEDAALEHASVAAFARLALQLMMHGAPAELIAQAQSAAIDEVRHASIAYALASRYGRREHAPGPLPLSGTVATSLEELLVETFLDGCVGELVAAAVAKRSAELCTDDALVSVYRTIAADEMRHAELGWRIVGWLLRLRPDLAARLRAATEALGVHSTSDDSDDSGPLAAHGVLADRYEAAVRSDVIREVVRPCVDALLLT